MAFDKCRVCGNDFFKTPLMHYKNMPKSAQHLPDAGTIQADRGVDLMVMQCACCGIVQLADDPVPYYRDVIRATGVSDEMRRFRSEQFKAFIDAKKLGGKKLIEIGCGCGEYLSILGALNVEAYGLEHSTSSVELCRKKGLKVSEGFVADETAMLNHGPFDGFFMLSFLEHLPDPNAVLRGIGNNLKDGGLGLVEVPNFDMIIRKKLFSEFISDHLFYFTSETLCALLNRNGFDVVNCSPVWHDYIISAVVKKRVPHDLSHFHEFQVKIKNELERFLNRFGKKKVAIWGAGHQSFAIISLTDITERIAYIVDSAPFKQNKFTPATHIPICSPETLHSDPVEAVIVMAASYSDEVTGILRNRFDKNLNIAIVRDSGLEVV